VCGEHPPWQDKVDAAIAELARRQHGVVARRQLLALGLSASAIHARATRGLLHRIHRGVYAVGHSVLGPDGWRMAAVLAAGRGAVLSHRSALDLHGVRRSQRSRHEVLTTRSCTVKTIEVHRTRSLPPADVTAIRRIPVTRLARALCDCTPLLTDQQLTRCIHEAEILRIFDGNAIRDPPPRLAALIAQYMPQPAHEGLETAFAELMRGADLPPHEFNAHVGSYEVDVLFPAQKLIVELDDIRTHRTTRAFQNDRERDATLMAQGYRTLRYTGQRMKRDPDGVIATLRATLGSPAP
jgi:very-short-patch-repair endonuclease